VTVGGVQYDRVVAFHPDTGARLAGAVIPRWPDVLTIAAALGRALEMGYVGVDVVLDAARGPVVLEANARPGLSIQIANRCGLLTRLATEDAGTRRSQTEMTVPCSGARPARLDGRPGRRTLT
jgi:hypothetical protein